MVTFREQTINEAQCECYRWKDGFGRNDIKFFHSIDKEGRHVTIGKAEYHGSFGLTALLEKIGGVNPPIICLPNYGAGYEYVARATCHPEDIYDRTLGEDIVTKRIYEKFHYDEAVFLTNSADFLGNMSAVIARRCDGVLNHIANGQGLATEFGDAPEPTFASSDTLFSSTTDDTGPDEVTIN